MNNTNRILALAALSITLQSACDAETEVDQPRAGELLFGLEDDDVEQIHARYLEGDEDLELTFARLTAPFDCQLYGDLCEQVGETGAIAITGELVDLALEGASSDAIEAYLDERLIEAMADVQDEDSEGVEFRASSQSNWVYHQDGSARLRVRTGITTPLVGTRKAWTEANTQFSGIGTWASIDAFPLCVNAGTNTQVYSICGGGVPCSNSTFESVNPGNTCLLDESWHRDQTSHQRKNGKSFSGGFWSSYQLNSRGCATANVQGISLAACALTHSRTY